MAVPPRTTAATKGRKHMVVACVIGVVILCLFQLFEQDDVAKGILAATLQQTSQFLPGSSSVRNLSLHNNPSSPILATADTAASMDFYKNNNNSDDDNNNNNKNKETPPVEEEPQAKIINNDDQIESTATTAPVIPTEITMDHAFQMNRDDTSIGVNRKAYTFVSNDYNDSDGSSVNTMNNIRSWGCERRHEAPLIFVHIGKAGGGSIRARLAASALDYNREQWAKAGTDTTYYYPMKEERRLVTERDSQKNTMETVVHKGIFINSQFPNFRPSVPKDPTNVTDLDMELANNIVWKTFEKTMPCRATTPLGQAIACPFIKTDSQLYKAGVSGEGDSANTNPRQQQQQQKAKKKRDACRGHRCNVVYVGHNLLGNEMHWLPTEYLEDWWKTTPWGSINSSHISGTDGNAMDSVQPLWEERATRWHPTNTSITNSRGEIPCSAEKRHPFQYYRQEYYNCVAPYEDDADFAANAMVDATIRDNQDWSHIYASLPVLRVTMMREPFSWLVSKFFWHKSMSGTLKGRNGTHVPLVSCDNNLSDFEGISEWAGPAIMKQLDHICGEDCLVRNHLGMMSLEQTERQARHNLQHSFAVVGLLNETDTFFDMITARVGYMNTSLNPHVTGGLHSTSKQEEYQRCSTLYKKPAFQKRLLAACPELAALMRLYEVAIQVNRHQMAEMQTCGLL